MQHGPRASSSAKLCTFIVVVPAYEMGTLRKSNDRRLRRDTPECETVRDMNSEIEQAPHLQLTTAAATAIRDAAKWAALRKPHKTTSLHLLLGLVHATGSIAEAVLTDNEISDANVWSAIDYWDPPRAGSHKAPRFIRLRPTPKWKSSALRVAAGAADEADNRGAQSIDSGDLLLALLREPGSRAVKILERSQLDQESLRALVKYARAEIEEGRGTIAMPNFAKNRPVRPKWESVPAR